MSENSTVARPYAKAVHEIARERGQADAWSALLEIGAAAVADDGFQRLLASPEHSEAALADLIIGICGEQADELGRNFFRVLAENERLGCLPEIRQEYERLRAEAENVVDGAALGRPARGLRGLAAAEARQDSAASLRHRRNAARRRGHSRR
jgi:F-type H+-transporting ATPase subunit delta